MFRLDKKIAFVTGAGSGIGEQIARLFAQQGAHVILSDIRVDAAERVASNFTHASLSDVWGDRMRLHMQRSTWLRMKQPS